MTKTHLMVDVEGHPFSPIIDGKFPHPIDRDSSEWTLQGKGGERAVILDIEKWAGGLQWHSLVMTEDQRSPNELDAYETACKEWGAVLSAAPKPKPPQPPTKQQEQKAQLNDLMAGVLNGTGLRPDALG